MHTVHVEKGGHLGENTDRVYQLTETSQVIKHPRGTTPYNIINKPFAYITYFYVTWAYDFGSCWDRGEDVSNARRKEQQLWILSR